MRKIKVATIAIVDGLIFISAVTAAILGIIYATTISAEYLLLLLVPVPATWLHFKFNRLCDRINGEMNGK